MIAFTMNVMVLLALLKIFQSFMFFLMFCNVFLPQTVFESLKGLTVVETIYKKSGLDRIFSPRIGNISS